MCVVKYPCCTEHSFLGDMGSRYSPKFVSFWTKALAIKFCPVFKKVSTIAEAFWALTLACRSSTAGRGKKKKNLPGKEGKFAEHF